jgi:molybdopterin synthase catalytic subunit
MSIAVSIIDGPLSPAIPPRADGAGAVLCFEGVVRPTEEQQAIDALNYEVYEPMAGSILESLAQQVAREFSLLGVRVEHSRGPVPVGGCSFRLYILSRHRVEGLQAMARFIDQMKLDVPIWKRPVYRSPTQAVK